MHKKTGYNNTVRIYSVIFLVFFAGMLLSNISYLTNPPYWDDVIGLHNQAIWYARHHFNIIKLWDEEVLWFGGSKIHPLGMMSFFYGMLYACFKPVTVHVIGHLFNILCLSLSMTLLVAMLRRYVGFSTALLIACVALMEPVMSGRITALGQECPLVLLVTGSLFFFQQRRYRMAYIVAVASFFIKQTGIVLLLAYLCFWLYMNVVSLMKYHRFSRHWKMGLLYLITVVVGIVLMKKFSNGAIHLAGMSVKYVLIRACGHVYYFHSLLAVKLMTAGVVTVFVLCRKRYPVRGKLLSLLILIFLAGFWGAYLIHAIPIPRYAVITVLPVWVLLVINMKAKSVRIFAGVFLIAHIIFMFHNWFPCLPASTARSGCDLERSREYLVDIDAQRRICSYLEKHAFHKPVVVKWPLVQMLTMPEFGYVTRALPNVYCVGMKPKYCDAKVYDSEKGASPDALYVYVPHCYRFAPLLYPVPGDLIWRSDESLPGTIYVYSKGDH